MNWTPKVPNSIDVTVSIPIENFQSVSTQYHRMLLAQNILESIEAAAREYQEFVDELKEANYIDIQQWPYPFTKKEI